MPGMPVPHFSSCQQAKPSCDAPRGCPHWLDRLWVQLMYIVLRGELAEVQVGSEGNEQRVELTRFRTGDAVWELGVLGLRYYDPESANRSNLSVEALQDGEAWCLSSQHLAGCLDGLPLCLQFMKTKALETRILKLSRQSHLLVMAAASFHNSAHKPSPKNSAPPYPSHRQAFSLGMERSEELKFYQKQHTALILESLSLQPDAVHHLESAPLGKQASVDGRNPPQNAAAPALSTASSTGIARLERLRDSLQTQLQRLEALGASFPAHAELALLEKRFSQAEHHMSTTEMMLESCCSKVRAITELKRIALSAETVGGGTDEASGPLLLQAPRTKNRASAALPLVQ